MKFLLASALLLVLAPASAQISAPGFEPSNETYVSTWTYEAGEGYTIAAQQADVHTGAFALRVRSSAAAQRRLRPFSQQFKLSAPGVQQRLELSAWIKADDINGSAGVWCNIYDAKGKLLNTGNARTQNTQVDRNSDWRRCEIVLLAPPGAQTAKIGGFIVGSGNYWFDDFELRSWPIDTTRKPSPGVVSYVEKAVRYAEHYSIVKDSVDWKQMRAELMRMSADQEMTEHAHRVVDYLLARLQTYGDNHSSLQRPDAVGRMQQLNVDGRQASGRFLEGNIAYVSVPGIVSMSDTALNNFAARIQTLIRELDTQHDVKGWIVDLRGNSGGNMYPMIAGLGPLLGEGVQGYFVEDGKQQAWHYKNGAAMIGKKAFVRVKAPYKLKQPETRLAVLIGPVTASSGEITAIAFSGKPNVRFIGQPSAGYVTANKSFLMKDHSMLHIASSYASDRKGKRFLDKIQPDEYVASSKEKSDAEKEAAMKWILGK